MTIINVILAVDKNYGIGKSGFLPWVIREELQLFKQKTYNNIVIVGKKTFETLPSLKDRSIYCVSTSMKFGIFKSINPHAKIAGSVEEAITMALEESIINNKKIFVIGGNQIYNFVFKHYYDILLVHLSIISKKYDCDTYFNKKHLNEFYVVSRDAYTKFDHYIMKYIRYGENQYRNLVLDVLINGNKRFGRNGETISDFGKHLKFDLRDGFPLLTTKKMFVKGIIEELLFFIRGDTDSKILEDKGINIWKGNTTREFLDHNEFFDRKEGEMGPMYGAQWRHFNSLYNDDKGGYTDYVWDDMCPDFPNFNIDQLQNIVDEIRTDPLSRRILMTSFNPSQVDMGVLWPCHSIVLHFYVQDEFLDMFCYNRSSDLFHGIPFNIASSALLLMIIAKLTNLTPRYLNLTLGDAHIYLSHIEGIKTQIERKPYIWPSIILPDIKSLEDVEKLTYEDFKIENYNSYPTIKLPMIA